MAKIIKDAPTLKKLKKIRGQKRIKNIIESWRINSLKPDIDKISENHYDYVKVWVSPFDKLRYYERDYTGPKSENRLLILNSLFDIYESWELELKKLNIPYYLRIWLYEPRITSSQVVCGIEDRIEHYQNIFPLETKKVDFPLSRYKRLENRIAQFDWTSAIDEEIFENDFWPKDQYLSEIEYFTDQKIFRRLESRQVRKEKISDETRNLIRYYIPKGHVWIGNKK